MKDKFSSEILKTSNTKLINKIEKIILEDEPKEYESNLKPLCIDDFNKMIDKYKLSFRPINEFGPTELEERHKLLFDSSPCCTQLQERIFLL